MPTRPCWARWRASTRRCPRHSPRPRSRSTTSPRTPARTPPSAAGASVATLTEVVDQHLLHEETDLEPLIHQHLDTPEWKAVEKKLRGGSVGDAGLFFAWLTDGMPDSDRAFLKTLIPAPVTFLLPRLFGRGYTRDVAPVWAG